jgi:hypothetical protein
VSVHLREDLFRLVCAWLPEPESAFLRAQPVDDYLTHLEAYRAVRRLDLVLPDELMRQFMASLLAFRTDRA